MSKERFESKGYKKLSKDVVIDEARQAVGLSYEEVHVYEDTVQFRVTLKHCPDEIISDAVPRTIFTE